MPFAPVPGSSEQPTLTRRAVSVALTIAVHLFLLLLLLRLAPHIVPMTKPATGPITINLEPDTGEQTARAKQAPSRKVSRAAASKAPAPPPPAPQRPPPPPPLPPVEILYLGHAEMASSDISRMPAARAPAAPASGSADSGDEDAPLGRGPQGQRLYAAQWYREPTDQELAFYLPKGRQVLGSGRIACQTIARFHVDNCVELGESPPGSGIGRAVLAAAWQFLVRPPRVEGRELVGEWVTIRIDYTDAGARPDRRR